jgi:CubicO group peptidase (beta-lactamase class C family)
MYMKTLQKTIMGLSLMINAAVSYSQNNLPDVYQPVLDKIKSSYNAKDYKGFYGLLSASFRQQQSEKEVSSFLKDNIYPYYGNMKTFAFSIEKEGFRYYKTGFDKGNLDMLLACNDKMEIEGFAFVPSAPETVKEKKKFISDNKKSTALDLKVDSLVSEFMSNPVNAGLSVAVIEEGVTYFYHYGEVKKGTAVLPNNSTIYEIGSTSKTFTGLLLAQAVIDKKLSLEDDIRKFLPVKCANLEYNSQPVKVKHLVTHTSRIPRIPSDIEKQKGYNELNPYKNYNKDMVYDYLNTLKLDTLPGIQLDYSNTGMALLGLILENVYKKSYEELVEFYIAKPFNMVNTGVNVPASKIKQFATGYNDNGIETPYWDLGDQAGAGGIRSTIADMAAYVGEQIKEDRIAIKVSHDEQFKGKKEAIAYAWFIQPTKTGDTILWHNGGTYGFTSFCGFIKEKKCGVVVLSNSGTGVDAIAVSLLKSLQK